MERKIFLEEEIEYLEKEGFNYICNAGWLSSEDFGAEAKIKKDISKAGNISLEFRRNNMFKPYDYSLELRQEKYSRDCEGDTIVVNHLKNYFRKFEEFKDYWGKNKEHLMFCYNLYP